MTNPLTTQLPPLLDQIIVIFAFSGPFLALILFVFTWWRSKPKGDAPKQPPISLPKHGHHSISQTGLPNNQARPLAPNITPFKLTDVAKR